MASDKPRLYEELASWFHLLTAPQDYAEEAAFSHQVLSSTSPTPPQTLLELGSGGGNNASHLKSHYRITLVDRSPHMLAVSHSLNSECQHIEGDMRTVRLERHFDAVFIHDAISYMTSEEDLKKAMQTSFVHCKPGGVALFVPDYVRENFVATTRHGGHDGERRALRYLEWTVDPDPADTTYTVDFAYLLREEDGAVRAEYDRHLMGLFPQEDWLRMLREVGFRPSVLPDPYGRLIFVALKPA